MPKALFTAKEFAAEQKREKRGPRPEVEDFDWPEDPEEQRELVTSMGRKALMKQAVIATRCLDEIERRDLGQEDLRAVASAARMGTDGTKDAHKALAELAPTRIVPEFNFVLATGEEDCPCCKRPWPKDLPRDMSGFDKPPAEA